MKFEYTLREEDYLEFQLFVGSQSRSLSAKLRQGRILLPVLLGVGAAICYWQERPNLAIYFGVVAVAAFLFGPRYFKWRFKASYVKHVREHYAARFDEVEGLEVREDHLFSWDKTGEAKTNFLEISAIYETGKHFFIKVNSGLYYIVPKAEIDDLDAFRTELKKMGVPLHEELEWKW